MPPNTASAAATPDVAAPARPAAPLVLEGVGKRYGRRAHVLRGMTHTFRPGTATALVGPNGSGKTTLLRLLTCLAFPTEGRIRYGDLDVHRQPYRYLAHVGVLHDGEGLPEALSAEEVLAWVLRARTGADAPVRRGAVLDAVRLDERRAEPVGTYSSGMRRKTQLAAALVARPSLLLLDEPFNGLDAESTAAAVDLLRRFAAAGGTVVFASHRPDPLEALADEIVTMDRLARDGTVP